jgi:hypothetical protein
MKTKTTEHVGTVIGISGASSRRSYSKEIAGHIPEKTDEERAVASEARDWVLLAVLVSHCIRIHTERNRIFCQQAFSHVRTFTESGSSTKLRVESTMIKNSDDGASLTPSPHPSVRQPFDNYTAVPRSDRRQKSIDSNRSPDRLSLFGGALSGSIVKSGKPAPRYSSYVFPVDMVW